MSDENEKIIKADTFVGRLVGKATIADALTKPYMLKVTGDANGFVELNNSDTELELKVDHVSNADNASVADNAKQSARSTYLT